MKKQIANVLTLLNLFCGAISVVLILRHRVDYVPILFVLSLVFDFLDGFVARKLGSSNELGMQLDSLADVVTFGLLPSVCIFDLMFDSLSQTDTYIVAVLKASVAFFILLMSAYRLAKFNIAGNENFYFVGLPTPANAVFILSVYYIAINGTEIEIPFIVSNYIVLLLITIMSGIVLNAKIPLWSLKISAHNDKNKHLLILFIGSLLLISFFEVAGVAFTIIWYILFSLCTKKTLLKKNY